MQQRCGLTEACTFVASQTRRPKLRLNRALRMWVTPETTDEVIGCREGSEKFTLSCPGTEGWLSFAEVCFFFFLILFFSLPNISFKKNNPVEQHLLAFVEIKTRNHIIACSTWQTWASVWSHSQGWVEALDRPRWGLDFGEWEGRKAAARRPQLFPCVPAKPSIPCC